MRTKRSPTFWFLYVVAIVTVLVGYWHGTRALATEKPAATPTQSQSQSQANAQTVNAGGGQGGGASNQLAIEGDKTTTTAIGLSTTSPIPLAMAGPTLPPCWLPTKARSYFFGAFAASSAYQRDPECVKDLEAQRAHEVALARSTADRAAECSEAARRELVACAKGE
jgi:hypothetical protein